MFTRRTIAILSTLLVATSVPFAISSCSDEKSLLSETRDATTGDRGAPGDAVKVQILALNDFHANLEPPSGSTGSIRAAINDPVGGNAGVPEDAGPDAAPTTKLVPAGGAVYLAAHIAALKKTNPNTAIVSAGDLTGGSPLVASLFFDEPAVLVMNAIGLDFNGVGNHEFDHGIGELLRLQSGGCNPVKGCGDGGAEFRGADFQYLAANVAAGKDKTIFPPYGIKEFDGVKVAFIGMTLEGTPLVTIPSGVAGLTFNDEVATVNALIPEIREQGASAIVVVIHEGAEVAAGSLYDACNVTGGAIRDIAKNLDSAVDVIVSGHTHQVYNCDLEGKLVTSAASFGRVVTQIELTIDPSAHRVTQKSAKNHVVTRDIAPDPTVEAIVAKYKELSAPLANRVIGQITAPLTRTPSAAGESILGDVVADAMLAATKKPDLGAQIALMNPGGLRSDIVCVPDCPSGERRDVTYAHAFTAQPFGNQLVTVTMTGAQLKTLLEEQFTVKRILQVSESLKYTYVAPDAGPATVDIASIFIDGQPITAEGKYRVTTNNFLATGGDGFSVFKQATDLKADVLDIEALEAYFASFFKAGNPLPMPVLGRIVKQ